MRQPPLYGLSLMFLPQKSSNKIFTLLTDLDLLRKFILQIFNLFKNPRLWTAPKRRIPMYQFISQHPQVPQIAFLCVLGLLGHFRWYVV